MRRFLICLVPAAVILAGCLSARALVTLPVSSKRTSKQVVGTSLHFTDVAAIAGLDYRWGNGGKHPLNLAELMGSGAADFDYDMGEVVSE